MVTGKISFVQIDKLCLDHFNKASIIVGWNFFFCRLGYPVRSLSLIHAITHHLCHEFFYLLPVLQHEGIGLAEGLPESRVLLMRMLGHSSLQMIFTVYYKWIKRKGDGSAMMASLCNSFPEVTAAA